jgi:tetratricopeptide (TPR) repeat protein
MKKTSYLSLMPALLAVIIFSFYSGAQTSVEELMANGNSLLRNGAYTEAASVFKQILAKEPRNFEAQANLAFAYLQLERYEKALTEYKKALSLDSKSSECWANLGFVYERLGKINDAAGAINKAIELNPSNIEARMNLAAMYENAGSFDKALAHYETVIKMDATKSDAYNGAIRCLTEKGNITSAKKYCQEAIANDPQNGEAHWLLGNILWKKENNTQDALKEYKAAVIINENSQVFYENLALLLEEMGKKDEALATWKKYLIYLDDAMKKEEVQKRIDKLEKGEQPVSKSEPAISKEETEKQSAEQLKKLKSELRKDSKAEAKKIETKPIDIGSDIEKTTKDEAPELDLRKEAKKKAESKK